MTDGDALLAAICAHPHDDTPRLAYADWLDEQGGPANADRAEFIRLQIELHPRPNSPPTPARRQRERRERALEKKYEKRWDRPLIGKGGPLFGDHTFTNRSRGFVHRVGGTAENWVANGDAVFRLAPVTNAGIDDLTDETLQKLVACGWAKRLETMELTSAFEYERDDNRYQDARPPDFARFAQASLPNLKWLWFSAGTLDHLGAAKVAAANPMPNLEILQLCQTPLSPMAVRNLFGGAAFTTVRELYFRNCGLTADKLGLIARSEPLRGVRELDLPGFDLDDRGLAALARGVFWPTLRRFRVTEGRLGAHGLRAVGEVPSDVEELVLSNCGITSIGLRPFASGGGLRNLTELSLAHNPLGDAGAIELTRWPGLARVKELILTDCGIGEEGAKALAACPAVAGLKKLFLAGNALGDAGYVALAESPHLGGIEWLYVGTVLGKKARTALNRRFGDRVSK